VVVLILSIYCPDQLRSSEIESQNQQLGLADWAEFCGSMWVQKLGTGKQVSPGLNIEDKIMEKLGKIGKYSNSLKASEKWTSTLRLRP
jgi:hypothetical protein